MTGRTRAVSTSAPETGASARNVEEITGQVAAGLGAERVDTRVGYASLAITIGIGPDWITRMRKVGPLV
jgi:hypothetical protein